LILPITNVDVIGDVIGDVMWSRNRLYILLSFAQLQVNSMNICLSWMKLPILVKISHTIVEMLTFNKWSLKVYRFHKRAFLDSWRSGSDLTCTRSSVLQLLSGQLVCVRVWSWTEDILNTLY